VGITKNKPTQTRINRKKYVNDSVNSEGFKKIKPGRRLFRSISIHLCHQKPNTARETVPLIGVSVAGEEAGTGSEEEEEEEDGVFSDDEGIEKDHDDSTGTFKGKVSRDFCFCLISS
jgi:hypothetical protein